MRLITVKISDSDMENLQEIAHIEQRPPEVLVQEQIRRLIHAKMIDTGTLANNQISPSESLANNDDDQRRRDAVEKIFGLWKKRQDAPKDGVLYQKILRAEWH
ncbi:hypothetical protein ACFOLJ_14090 [Rugamonas sp. CCM 8940]|uniref:hypothetical protein n=1 Tax=Rugamonas sp. CCM 8940 TaxID=2765359 RepID=UPI0018F361E1|nr:hypothetical protein [Rugamonas sp. CCM 8940]MBJ7311355.1 hypothetical protein [Rugamonas sp. CCM 8940]